MAIYYISNTGNDGANGTTINTPWQNLSKISSTTFSAGDQILFKRGNTWYGSITINQSGTSGNPITFGAYGTGANPIITGFTTVAAWTNLGGNIWESTSTVSSLSTCNMVTIGGVNTAMGRYPKINAANGGYLTIASHSTDVSITCSSLTGTPNWTGAEVVARTSNFNLNRATITSQSGSTINFGNLGQEPTDGAGFFIQNNIQCLTQQNDWYYNPSTHKIRIYSTSQPSNVNVSSVETLVPIQTNYLTFNNITFTGANGCAFYCWDNSPRYNHITITNCSFISIGVNPIYVLINYLVTENNTIIDCNSGAIQSSYGTDVSIRYNNIQNIGIFSGMRRVTSPYELTNSAVSCAIASNFTVEYNTVKNVGYNAIDFYGDNILIKNNYVDTFCTVLDDGGGIYTFTGGRSVMNNVIINGNIILNGIGVPYGEITRFGAAGIYLDELSKNIEVYNNSVANTYMYGIQLNTVNGYCNVHDNTVYNASQYQYWSTYWGNGTVPTNNQVNNNIFVAKISTNDGGYDYQKCIGYYFTPDTGHTLLKASFTANNNYYARPINDTKIAFINDDWPAAFKTLAEWKTFSGQDANSHGSPQSVSTTNDIHFVYNETGTAKNFTLSTTFTDITNATHSGTLTLQPYTSIVLLGNGTITEGGGATLKYIMSGSYRIMSGGSVITITN
jgi:hypothetical protein